MPPFGHLPDCVMRRVLARLEQRDRLRCRVACRAWAALPVRTERLRVRDADSFARFVDAGGLERGGLRDLELRYAARDESMVRALESMRRAGVAPTRSLSLSFGAGSRREVAAALVSVLAAGGCRVDAKLYPEYRGQGRDDLSEFVETVPGLRSLRVVSGIGHYTTLEPSREMPGLVELEWACLSNARVSWDKFPGLERVRVGWASWHRELFAGMASGLPRLESLWLCDPASSLVVAYADQDVGNPTVRVLRCAASEALHGLQKRRWRFPRVERLVLDDMDVLPRHVWISRDDFRRAFPLAREVELRCEARKRRAEAEADLWERLRATLGMRDDGGGRFFTGDCAFGTDAGRARAAALVGDALGVTVTVVAS